MITINKILCPVDFSPASNAAVKYAVGLAANYEAKVHLFHVIAPVVPTMYEYPIYAVDIDEAARRELHEGTEKTGRRGSSSRRRSRE